MKVSVTFIMYIGNGFDAEDDAFGRRTSRGRSERMSNAGDREESGDIGGGIAGGGRKGNGGISGGGSRGSSRGISSVSRVSRVSGSISSDRRVRTGLKLCSSNVRG